MRLIKFKGKSILKGSEGKWITGYYFVNHDNLHMIYDSSLVDGWFSHPIDTETLSQFTDKTTCKNNELFENDIVFDEVPEEEGDIRFYYICKWIPEWARFVFLSYGELFQYENNGMEQLIDDGTFGLESSEKMHYAGNIFDNKEIWENQ